MRGLLIGPTDELAMRNLTALAAEHVVNIPDLLAKLSTSDGKAAHREQMTRQTIALSGEWLLTYSIESGHPAGLCRHLSVSVQGGQLVPSREAVWLLAAQFGFTGGLEASTVWLEELRGHGQAVNVVQPFST